MLLIKDHVANPAENSSLAQNTYETETEKFLDGRQTWTDKCAIEMRTKKKVLDCTVHIGYVAASRIRVSCVSIPCRLKVLQHLVFQMMWILN